MKKFASDSRLHGSSPMVRCGMYESHTFICYYVAVDIGESRSSPQQCTLNCAIAKARLSRKVFWQLSCTVWQPRYLP
eukprot:6207811-Pleurochrysis_carterae.AAC.1